jgi:hypothetical protein
VGAPHIHGELLKIGIEVSESSVATSLANLAYLPKQPRPKPGFHRFLKVPPIRFQVLYAFLVLAHDRRRVLHFNATAHPTAEWTAQQLREAFPFDQVPRYLLRDRDRIFGNTFQAQVKDMQIKEVLSAPRSPW